jgi:hypothetical protein
MLTQRNAVRLTAAMALSALFSGCGDNDVLGVQAGQGDTFAVTSMNRLVTFSRNSPSVSNGVAITGLQSGENVLGIDIRPADGKLYALGSSGSIYTIDTGSGAATAVSTLTADTANTPAGNPLFTALDGATFGVDFNPVVDRMRVISDTGQNLRIAVDSGATITDGNLNAAGTVRTGLTEAGYTNSFSAACTTTLFFIDANTDRLVRTPDPNNGALIDVGSLGVDSVSMAGFEIVSRNDGTTVAFAALMVAGAQGLYQIDLTSGAATSLGSINGLMTGETVRGLAIGPPSAPQSLGLGDVLAVTASNKLLSFASGTPQKLCASASITGLGAGENVVGIDTRTDGTLYALTDASALYTIDTGNNFGQATFKSRLSVPLDGTQFGVDFNPVPDRLRIVSDNGQNLRVNVDTGAVTVDTPLNDVTASTPASSVSGAAYTNSFAGALGTTLYVLDAANDRLMIQGAAQRGNGPTPNNGDLTAVGPLNNGDIQAVTDLEINGVNNTALAVVSVGNATTSDLNVINLTTGAARRVNTIGGGEVVVGLTYRVARSAVVYGVTADNRLVSFRPSAPGTASNLQPISGLQGGESIVGMDVRPSNNRIYALTDGGRLYTLDPSSAQVSPVGSLVAGASTPAFSTLAGTEFGVDFNPQVDRLRTVSTAGENLRTDTISGVTLVDVSLNPAPVSVTAAAYIANFENSRATSLFVIDTGAGSLRLQNPPNAGTLGGVGTGQGLDASTTFASTSGFDIVGGDNGLVLAALQPTGTTETRLYQVSLSTGAATLLLANNGRIGSGVSLRSFAIRLE